MATSHHVSVLASTPHWDQAFGLEPNSTWVIIPSNVSLYSINNKATYIEEGKAPEPGQGE